MVKVCVLMDMLLQTPKALVWGLIFNPSWSSHNIAKMHAICESPEPTPRGCYESYLTTLYAFLCENNAKIQDVAKR